LTGCTTNSLSKWTLVPLRWVVVLRPAGFTFPQSEQTVVVLQQQGICPHKGCAVAGVCETGQVQVRFGMVSDGCASLVHLGVSLVAYCYRECAESSPGVPRMVQYLEPDPPYHMETLPPTPPFLELEKAK
jgi:hypothetical protein